MKKIALLFFFACFFLFISHTNSLSREKNMNEITHEFIFEEAITLEEALKEYSNYKIYSVTIQTPEMIKEKGIKNEFIFDSFSKDSNKRRITREYFNELEKNNFKKEYAFCILNGIPLSSIKITCTDEEMEILSKKHKKAMRKESY